MQNQIARTHLCIFPPMIYSEWFPNVFTIFEQLAKLQQAVCLYVCFSVCPSVVPHVSASCRGFEHAYRQTQRKKKSPPGSPRHVQTGQHVHRPLPQKRNRQTRQAFKQLLRSNINTRCFNTRERVQLVQPHSKRFSPLLTIFGHKIAPFFL